MKGCLVKTALLVSFSAGLAACRTVVPVTGHENHGHLEKRWHAGTDSVLVYVRDSVRIYEKGDTLRIEHWRERYRDRLHVRTDSIHVRDSIYRQVPVMVAKPLTAWQKFLMKTGMFGLLALAATAAVFLGRLAIRKTLR